MLKRTRTRIRRIARRLLGVSDDPERVARGIAAGFFAAAIPTPGLQIPISLLCAWLVGGNKVVAVVPQFLVNAVTMPLLVYLQLRLGEWLLPLAGTDIDKAGRELLHIADGWSWSAPAQSMETIIGVLGHLGAGVLGPLLLGIAITAVISGAASYPLALIGVISWNSYRARKRHERGRGLRLQRGSFVIPEDEPRLTALDAATVLHYAARSSKFARVDSATLLTDGQQAFPEMLRCIDAARSQIEMETYILNSDHTGSSFSAALCRAAQRGVAVRLCFDGVGAMGLPHSYVDTLLRAGVRVAVFRPFSMLWKLGLGAMNRRNHRKTLVIDGNITFTGGLNIGDEYAALAQGGGGWRDTHVRIDSDAVARQFQQLMRGTWRKSRELVLANAGALPPLEVPSSGAQPIRPGEPLVPTTTNASVQVVSNRELLQRVRVRRAYMHAIRRARQYVLIENAYFIPDRGIRRALRNAVKRGVKVGVVVAMYSDVEVAAMASRSLYGELLSNGVRLFEYPLAMMHCKVAVIDDVWSVVSTYNLDHRSLMHNLEAGVFLMDRPFAHALRDQIVNDISRCREVTLRYHAARPWNLVLMENLAYQARYWL